PGRRSVPPALGGGGCSLRRLHRACRLARGQCPVLRRVELIPPLTAGRRRHAGICLTSGPSTTNTGCSSLGSFSRSRPLSRPGALVTNPQPTRRPFEAQVPHRASSEGKGHPEPSEA